MMANPIRGAGSPISCETISNFDFYLVFLTAGVFGGYLGISLGTDQFGVECGQVLAGIVQYPSDNPFYAYQVKVWTLCNQIPALMLWLGLSERLVGVLLTGMQGVLSFQALALCTLALSRNKWVSLAVPLWVFSTGQYDFGIIYFIRMLGTCHTYGVIGLAFGLLTYGLLGVGRTSFGIFCLAIAPAIHPAIGIWCWGVTVLSHLFSLWSLGTLLAANRVPLLFGAVITVSSFAYQQYACRNLPEVPESVISEYANAYYKYWDPHVKPVALNVPAIAIALHFLPLGFTWLVLMKGDSDSHARLLLRLLLLSTTIALFFCVISRWPSILPRAVMFAMPGRYINFTTLAFPAIVIGLIARHLDKAVNLLLLALLAILYNSHIDHATWKLTCAGGLLLMFWRYNDELNCAEEPRIRKRLLGAYALMWVTLPLAFSFLYPTMRFASAAIGVIACLSIKLIDRTTVNRGVHLSLSIIIISGGLASLLSLTHRNLASFGRLNSAPLEPWVALLFAAFLCFNYFRMHGIVHLCRRSSAEQSGNWLDRAWVLPALGIAIALVAWKTQVRLESNFPKDYSNDKFFASAKSGSGLLLTSSDILLAQLVTQRPVLLEAGALSQLRVLPEAGERMNSILRDVYGVDLLNPPAEIRAQGAYGLLPDTGKALWESRTVDEWRAISAKHGVTDILTYSNWQLALPETARCTRHGYVLYHIPVRD